MSLAKKIEQTLLRPDCTSADVQKLCTEAIQFDFAGVCIPPYYVKDAYQILQDSTVKLVTVVGFPMGYSTTSAKVEEIKRAIDEGADEIDVVANISAIKNGNWNYVKNDIESTTRAVHLKGKVVKIIIETGLLDEDEIKSVCEICEQAGPNFVKTSTGINSGGATESVIRLLRSSLPPSIKIKASGGIRTQSEALSMIKAGADRIGTSSGLAILKG